MTPEPKTAVQVIDRALELIATQEQWIKGFLAEDKRGEAVDYMSTDATCFCLIGAVERAIGEARSSDGINSGETRRVFVAMRMGVPSSVWDLPSYNDLETTTHADILNLLTKARAGLVGKS